MLSLNNNNSFEKYISSTDTPHYKLEEYIINNNGNKQLSYKLYDKNTNTTYIINDKDKKIIDNYVNTWSSNNKKPCRKSELHHSAFGGKRKSRRNLRKNINKTRKNIGGYRLANIDDFAEIDKYERKYLVTNPSIIDYIDAFGKEHGEINYNNDIKKKEPSFYFKRKPLDDELIMKMECSANKEKYNKNIDFITVYKRVDCGENPESTACEGDHVTKRQLSGLYNEFNPFSKTSIYNKESDACYKRKLQDIKERKTETERESLQELPSRSSSPATVTVTDTDIDTFFDRMKHGGCSSCAARVLLTSKKNSKKNSKKKSNKKTKKKGGSKGRKGKKAKKTNSSKKKVNFKQYPVTREEGTYSDTEFEIEPGEDRLLVMRNSRIPDYEPYYSNEDDNPYVSQSDLDLYFYNNKANKGEYSRCDIGDICEDASIVLYDQKKELIENEILKLEEKYKGNKLKDKLIERDLRQNYDLFDDIQSQFIITSIYQPEIINKIDESDDEEVVINYPPVKKKGL